MLRPTLRSILEDDVFSQVHEYEWDTMPKEGRANVRTELDGKEWTVLNEYILKSVRLQPDLKGDIGAIVCKALRDRVPLANTATITSAYKSVKHLL